MTDKTRVTRRNFLAGAAGASTLAFPMIAKAQGPIAMRWQSTWPSKDIFHEYALDFAKKVNDMTGGELKIEVLPAGAVVPAFGLHDAVSKGTLDRGLLEEVPAGGLGGLRIDVLLLHVWLLEEGDGLPGRGIVGRRSAPRLAAPTGGRSHRVGRHG